MNWQALEVIRGGKGVWFTVRLIPLSTLLGLGLAGCSQQEAVDPGRAISKSVKAEILTIGETSTPDTFEVVGTVRSMYNAILASKVMGRVVSVSGREGDPIKKGQPLVFLDPRELEAAVNIANANYHAAVIGVGNASTASDMEGRTSKERIAQAESQVRQALAALAQAEARRDLALAGPRTQEIVQSHLAVVEAESNLKLAKSDLQRTTTLVHEGAIPGRELDLAQNRYEIARGRLDIATQSESIAKEGSRTQDIKGAQDNVDQEKAAVTQARSAVTQARASALQVVVRQKEIESAKAQVEQASAAVQSALVALSYAQVLAPFDGRIVQRLVDPGSMASPGSPLLAVEGGQYRLEASVPERVLKSVAIGSVAAVKIDAMDGAVTSGRVTEIVPAADSTTHAFVVKFGLPELPGIKSGMFGHARIGMGLIDKLFIPNSATWQREGLHYVYSVDKGGIARLRIVTLGDEVRDKIEVLSGLGIGDRVIVGSREGIFDGVRIEGLQR